MFGKRKAALSAVAIFAVAALNVGTLQAADVPSELDADVISYDMSTGEVKAEGNVLMKHGNTRVAGQSASYNMNSRTGTISGGIIAESDDMRMTAQQAELAGEAIKASGGVDAVKGTMHLTAQSICAEGNHYSAAGNVQATDGSKSFSGESADYQQDQGYVLLSNGGTITTQDGTFSAGHMEGWLNDGHYKGTGDAHVKSTVRDFEGGGDTAEYDSARGIAELTGNAWGVQGNNTVRSGHLTVHLADNGKAGVK